MGAETVICTDISKDGAQSGTNLELYRELQTLRELGWVTDTPVEQSGKPDKKIFSVTDEGRAELERWLSGPFEDRSRRIPLLMRVFFSGELPADGNIAFFRAIAIR